MGLLKLALTVFLVVCLVTENEALKSPPCDSFLLCDGDVTYDTIYPYPAGSSANVSCDMGYTLSGSDNLTCYFNFSSVSSYWIPEVPTCEINECESITLDHGIISYTHGSEYGSTATFYCESGYELSGESSITCQEDENWSEAVPTCESGAGNLSHSQFLIMASLALLLFKSA